MSSRWFDSLLLCCGPGRLRAAFWRLSQILAKIDPAKANNVRALIQNHLASMPDLTDSQLITTSAVHGNEDTPNDPQSWASATSLTLTA
jgi:hypothetical protein